MKRVLLVQPSMQPPGGANGVAAWALQALVAEHRVTVLSWHPVDIEPINRFYGTHLHRSDFDTIAVPRSRRLLVDHLPTPMALIKLSLLMRYTRRVSAGFDVLFGVCNETDYGRRGIQYVHYPTYLRPRPEVDLRWYHPPQGGMNLYYALADRIADFSLDRLKANLTLVNSDWTGEQVSQLLGIKTRTLYPPVVDPAARPAWEERRTAFLAIGRISPEKEYERVMRILARVRERVPELTLTIVGTSDRHTRGYCGIDDVAGAVVGFVDPVPRQPDARRGARADGVTSLRHSRHARRTLRDGAGRTGARRRRSCGCRAAADKWRSSGTSRRCCTNRMMMRCRRSRRRWPAHPSNNDYVRSWHRSASNSRPRDSCSRCERS